jgi:hypothetical protein
MVLVIQIQNIKPSGNGIWQSIAISKLGQYQVAAVSNTVGQGNIYISVNYGSTWNDALFGVQNGWQSIAISSTGQYITAIQSGNVTNPKGNIWINTNYGAVNAWSSSQQIYSYVPFSNGFLNQGSVDFNKTVSISMTGKYQTALGLANTSDTTGNANIWINNNFGLGSWIDTGYRALSINGAVSTLASISMVDQDNIKQSIILVEIRALRLFLVM